MGRQRDWTQVRAEYEDGGLSFSRLAAKYNIAIGSIKKAAKREGWKHRKTARVERVVRVLSDGTDKGPEGTGEGTTTTEQEPCEVVVIEAASARIMRLADMAMDRIEEALNCVLPIQTDRLKQLTGAIKDLSVITGAGKDELDREEQRARIDKLRAEAAAGSRGGGGQEIVVRFEDMEEVGL